MKKIYFLPVIITQWIIRLITKVIFSVFCNLKVEGLENLDGHKGPIIFASNHASEWDGPLIPVPIKFSPMFYVGMTKKKYKTKRFGIRRFIYGGLMFRLIGVYPVYYGLKDYKKSLKNHIDFLNKGFSVTIFPEGRCSRDGKIADFRKGVIALSHETNTKIIPIYIGDTYSMRLKTFLLRKRNVVVRFGQVYMPSIDKKYSEEELLCIYREKSADLRERVLILSKKVI